MTDEEVRLEEVSDWSRVTEQGTGNLGARLLAHNHSALLLCLEPWKYLGLFTVAGLICLCWKKWNAIQSWVVERVLESEAEELVPALAEVH